MIALGRVRPLTLQALLEKRPRYYRDALLLARDGVGPPITTIGPGGVELQEPESSFGLLYAASLVRTLANDMRLLIQRWPGCAPARASWPSHLFWGEFVARASSPTSIFPFLNCSSSPAPAFVPAETTQSTTTNTTASASAAGEAERRRELALWSAAAANSNDNKGEGWTWLGVDGAGYGTVDRSLWLSGARFAACNASFHATFPSSSSDGRPSSSAPRLLAAKAISLCEPAPTEGLQTFCKSLLRYRMEVTNVNCILSGDGSCLYQPGAFYMPYAWSPTNQKFAADTVATYYAQTVLVCCQ